MAKIGQQVVIMSALRDPHHWHCTLSPLPVKHGHRHASVISIYPRRAISTNSRLYPLLPSTFHIVLLNVYRGFSSPRKISILRQHEDIYLFAIWIRAAAIFREHIESWRTFKALVAVEFVIIYYLPLHPKCTCNALPCLPWGICMIPTVRPAIMSGMKSCLRLYRFMMPRKGRCELKKLRTHDGEHSHFLTFDLSQVHIFLVGRLPPSNPWFNNRQ